MEVGGDAGQGPKKTGRVGWIALSSRTPSRRRPQENVLAVSKVQMGRKWMSRWHLEGGKTLLIFSLSHLDTEQDARLSWRSKDTVPLQLVYRVRKIKIDFHMRCLVKWTDIGSIKLPH